MKFGKPLMRNSSLRFSDAYLRNIKLRFDAATHIIFLSIKRAASVIRKNDFSFFSNNPTFLLKFS